MPELTLEEWKRAGIAYITDAKQAITKAKRLRESGRDYYLEEASFLLGLANDCFEEYITHRRKKLKL